VSTFTSPVDLRMLGDYRWELLAEFGYYTGCYPDISVIRVPAGTITDLASVPRLLWVIFPPHGEYAKAAIVHDYLYQEAVGTKRWADDVFLEAMTVLGVARWRRSVMYWAVRWFGRGNYR